MIAAIDFPPPTTVQRIPDSRPVDWGRSYELAFSPRFRGFQTMGSCRHPRRLANILRTLDARSTVVDRDILSSPEEENWGADIPAAAESATGPGAADRRRFHRRQSSNLVRVLPFGEFAAQPDELEWALHESPFRGQMLDISMNGVAFLLRQPMTASDRIWLKLECRARDFAVVRSARVIRVVPTSPDHGTVTCRFDHCVPYADVVQLSVIG